MRQFLDTVEFSSTRVGAAPAVALLALCAAMVAAGCASTAQEPDERPFFQQEYGTESHGRKTLLDRLVEVDPGKSDVLVAPDYFENAPERIAILPFADLGSANLVVDKIQLTHRDQEERNKWAWTDAQRFRRATAGYMARREFTVMNMIAVDAVLQQHQINDYRQLEKLPPEQLGEWLGVDAVVYGEVTHYEAYYLFLAAAWHVEVRLRMVSTHDGHTLVRAKGGRYDATVAPALGVEDMVINSGVTLLEMRDINLARAEEEACREVVTRIPESGKLEDELRRNALEYNEEAQLRHSVEMQQTSALSAAIRSAEFDGRGL